MEKFPLEKKETHEGENRDLSVIFRVEGDARKEVDRLIGVIEDRVELISKVDESRHPHISFFQG